MTETTERKVRLQIGPKEATYWAGERVLLELRLEVWLTLVGALASAQRLANECQPPAPADYAELQKMVEECQKALSAAEALHALPNPAVSDA